MLFCWVIPETFTLSTSLEVPYRYKLFQYSLDWYGTAVRVEGGFGRYRWFVYIIMLLLRKASWLLYCIVGHLNLTSAPPILLVLLEPHSKAVREKSDCTDLRVIKPTNQVLPSSGFRVPLCNETCNVDVKPKQAITV